MKREELVNQIFSKKSFLCVGLDIDLKKIPARMLEEEEPIFAFNKMIIDATAPYCVAYKPNLAFYECLPYSLHHRGCQAWRYRKYEHDVCQDIL